MEARETSQRVIEAVIAEDEQLIESASETFNQLVTTLTNLQHADAELLTFAQEIKTEMDARTKFHRNKGLVRISHHCILLCFVFIHFICDVHGD